CWRLAGMGHLEDPTVTGDLFLARDFDQGTMGPPLFISMDFVSSGLVEIIAGVASAVGLFWFSWWAPLLLAGAWAATHYLLRESSVWKDRNTEEVKAAQRDSDYAYRIAVDPPAAKKLRLFGPAGWVIERFVNRRTRLHELQYEATRIREKPLLWSALLVTAANVLVFWFIATQTATGSLDLGKTVIFAQCALGTSLIAFGGFNWALDWAASPVGAVLKLQNVMKVAGALKSGTRDPQKSPGPEIRFRDVTF